MQVLRSPGTPLDEATRLRMQPYLGDLRCDLRNVRVHTDTRAAVSAEAIGAAAYTWKDHVVFGAGRWAPGTRAGHDLLAHELVHAAQQQGANADGSPQLASKDHSLERNARAVLAGSAAPQAASRAVVQRQSLNEPLPPVSLGMRPKTRPSITPGRLGFHLLPSDRQTISDFLGAGGLQVGPDWRPVFQGRPMSLDQLTDLARPLVLPIVPRGEVRNFVGGAFLRALATITQLPPPPAQHFVLPQDDVRRLTTVPGSTGGAVPQAAASEWTAAAGGQWTYHLSSRNPQTSNSAQVQFQRGSGAVSEVIQFQVDLNTGVAQPMGGIQLQYSKTVTVLGIALQGAAFLQLMGGLTQAPGSLSGDVTFQIQGGLQATATFGTVSVALQVGLSVTAQGNQPAAVDFNVAPQAGGPNRFGPIDTPGGGQVAGFTVRF